MELSIKMNGTCSGFTETVSVNQTESDIWKEIGKRLLKAEVPSEIIASCSLGSASLNIRQRGTFVRDGITYPSMYVTVSYNNISVPADTYSEAYLTCVNPECNNYKFYHLRPTGSVINATYGRIGSQRGEAFGVKDLSQPYESYLYWVRYYEKISKGYVDQTEIYLSPKKARKTAKKVKVEPTDETKPKINQLSAALYSQLKGYARHVVRQNLRNYENITAKQISKGKYFLRQMGQRVTVKGFNSQLKNLISISPRNTRDVSALFAKSVNDFAAIVQREENLLLAMEAMVQGEKTPEYIVPEECFEAHGIKVLPATEKQKTDIMSRLSANLQGKVKNIYRVINPKQQERFDNYLKTENIKKVKMFWHGSRNGVTSSHLKRMCAA